MGVKEICDSSGIQTRKWCIVIVCIYYTFALPILLVILVIPVTSSYWKYETGKAQVFLKFESPQWLCVQEPQLAPPFLHLVGLGIIGFSELSFLSPFILQVGYPCPMCRVLIPNLLFSKHSYLVSNTTSRNSQKKKNIEINNLWLKVIPDTWYLGYIWFNKNHQVHLGSTKVLEKVTQKPSLKLTVPPLKIKGFQWKISFSRGEKFSGAMAVSFR